MQFLGKFNKVVSWHKHPRRVGTLCENPGSATENVVKVFAVWIKHLCICILEETLTVMHKIESFQVKNVFLINLQLRIKELALTYQIFMELSEI